jgi:hypothetical protein
VVERHGGDMAKLSMPAEAAAALRVSERMLLFCVASNTDWQHTTIPGEIVTTMVVKGLIERDAGGHLCGFRRLRPGIPIERGHAFRSKAATCSDEGGRGVVAGIVS